MKTAILFPGQGSQFIGMGKKLYQEHQQARHVMHEVDEALQYKLSDLIFEGDIEELTLTHNAQPAIMAVSIAACRVLLQVLALPLAEVGQVLAGHSLGEYTALCASGVLTLGQAAKLLRLRGQLMQKATPLGVGKMVALLGAKEEDVNSLAESASAHGVCEIANDNGGGQFVLSGHTSAIDYVCDVAKDFGIKRAVVLNVSAPFHCSLMQRAAEGMECALQDEIVQDFTVPVLHNFTATINSDPRKVKEMLTQQLCGRVRWRESMQKLEQCSSFLEIGPGRVLSGLISKIHQRVEAFNLCEPIELQNYISTRDCISRVKEHP